MKNSLEGFNSRLDQAEESVSKLKDTSFGNYPVRGTKRKKNEESLMDLWDTIEHITILIMRAPEEEKR